MPALGNIIDFILNNLAIISISPFSIELAPSEQNISIVFGLCIIIMRKYLINLITDPKDLINVFGGGWDICDESNLIILKSLKEGDWSISSQERAIPPYIFFDESGNPPIINILELFNLFFFYNRVIMFY